jgi:hypothetical protein
VPRNVYEKYGEKAWMFLDTQALMALDRLRKRFGPMTVNNYYWGGPREWSGLRTKDSPYYSAMSQHSFGKAFDCVFSNCTAEEVRRIILSNPNSLDFELINSLELNVSWLHFDTRNCNRIMTYSP